LPMPELTFPLRRWLLSSAAAVATLGFAFPKSVLAFCSAADRAGLTLTVDCPPLRESIYVDREMWEKIVLNLLSNAFKHTFEGGIAVRLRWLGDSAQLTVEDSGVGIAAGELPRLFDRFHRVKGAASRTHEGTGRLMLRRPANPRVVR
jgi:signal transduction histidine kinase